jgi:hypothetical protein
MRRNIHQPMSVPDLAMTLGVKVHVLYHMYRNGR